VGSAAQVLCDCIDQNQPAGEAIREVTSHLLLAANLSRLVGALEERTRWNRRNCRPSPVPPDGAHKLASFGSRGGELWGLPEAGESRPHYLHKEPARSKAPFSFAPFAQSARLPCSGCLLSASASIGS
jgi:hypothetical protein